VRFAQERLKGIRRGRGAGSREVGRWQGRWDLGNKGVGGGGWGVGDGRISVVTIRVSPRAFRG